MLNFLIVWHSRTTASQQLALAAYKAAQNCLHELQATSDIQVHCLAVDQVQLNQVLAAQAYLFCAPENLGSLSGECKAFFDRFYYGALDQINGRIYGALISAGSDGQGAARQLERICTGWRLQAIQKPIIIHTQAQTPEQILAPKTLSSTQLQTARDLGALLAARLALAL